MEPEVEWRRLPAKLGLSRYLISNDGRVRNTQSQQLLEAEPRTSGYRFSTLQTDDGHRVTLGNHVLVAHAFLPTDGDRPHLDHINHVRDDNRVTNLRRVTSKENAANRAPIKRPSRVVEQLDEKGNVVKTWSSAKEAADTLDIHANAIHRCCAGSLRTTGGFGWRYPPAQEAEEWRDVIVDGVKVGASSLGRIKLQRGITEGTKDAAGRRTVQVVDATGRAHRHPIHTLVCRAFHGEAPSAESYVRHLDRDPSNNRAPNLEWSTLSEICMTRAPRNSSNTQRAVTQYTREGMFVAKHESITAAVAAVPRTDIGNIVRCCKDHTKTCGGYLWRYTEGLDPQANVRPQLPTKRAGNPVSQYTKDGVLVATYESVSAAVAAVPGTYTSNISRCCKEKTGTVAGFVWRCTSDVLPDGGWKVPVSRVKRCVEQYTMDGDLVATYSSLKDATVALPGVSAPTICNCCAGRTKSAGGFHWKYRDRVDASTDDQEAEE